jgi:hypothetical protein
MGLRELPQHLEKALERGIAEEGYESEQDLRAHLPQGREEVVSCTANTRGSTAIRRVVAAT